MDDAGDSTEPSPNEQTSGEPTDTQVIERVRSTSQTIAGIRNRPLLLLIYPSTGSISPHHSVTLYQQFMEVSNIENLDIILHSAGGDIHEAYDMLKLCRSYTDEELSVIVPLKAMSAATLMALGADKVYLSKIGNLGPLDPQVRHPGWDEHIPVRAIRDIPDVLEKGLESSSGEVNNNLKGESIIKPIAEQVDPYILADHEETPEVAVRYGRKILSQRGISKQIADRCLNTLIEFPAHTYNIDLHEIKANPSLSDAIDAKGISQLPNGEQLEEQIIALLNLYLIWDYKHLKQGEGGVEPVIELIHPEEDQQTLDEAIDEGSEPTSDEDIADEEQSKE